LKQNNKKILEQQNIFSMSQTIIFLNDFFSDYLNESLRCLEVEPEGTKESSIAKLAKKALSQTKEIILFSDFL